MEPTGTVITTMHKHILQKRSRCSDLASRFYSFKYTEVHNDPGEEEIAEEFPPKSTSFFNAIGFLQELVTGKKRHIKVQITRDSHYF